MKRIIIADDSATARMFIRQCLSIVGFPEEAFVDATNGKEALARLREGPADLLVTDLTMPEMDGTELLRRVKASPRHNEMPVVVVTSAGNPAKEAELRKLGALAILAKPVSPAVVSEALEDLLDEEDA